MMEHSKVPLNPIKSMQKSILSEYLANLRALNPADNFSAIVIGSVARGTETEDSDLDLLVVSEAVLRLPQRQPPLHVHHTTVPAFLERLRNGDDFAAWSIRFGLPVTDQGLWRMIEARPESKQWPDWREKVPLAARRLLLGAELLRIGDVEAASEELLYALSHVARGLLLRADVFPLSRMELAGQVVDLGYPELGRLIMDLIHDGTGNGVARRAQLYARKLLSEMDAQGYREFLVRRREHIESKDTERRASDGR